MSDGEGGPDLGWRDIFPEPFVVLLLGARGEGKSALSHRLVEEFEDDDRDAYIMGFPRSKADLLPDEIEILPATTTQDEWPENSIVLIHEAHQVLHARRSMDAENLELDQLVTVSRHKDSDIIYDTQQSQRLDKNAVAAVDGICVRWPALMQEQFERRALRPIISDARDALSKYVNVHDEEDYTYVERKENDNGVDLLKKHVYVHADQFRGEYPHEVELAEHWSEEISKAYSDPDADTEESDEAGEESGEDDEDPLDAFIEDDRMSGVLERALQYEQTLGDDWEAADVGAAGGHISAMLTAGIIQREYRSNSTKTFSLSNPSRVEDKLAETA